MKQRLLIKALKEAGYHMERQDGDHIIFEKEDCHPIQVPKHKEINNNTARKILSVAGIKAKLKK